MEEKKEVGAGDVADGFDFRVFSKGMLLHEGGHGLRAGRKGLPQQYVGDVNVHSGILPECHLGLASAARPAKSIHDEQRRLF